MPTAPRDVVARGVTTSASVEWTPPASDGDSPITGYTVTPYVGGVAQDPVQAPAGATSRVVTGLTNGTATRSASPPATRSAPGRPSAPSNAATPQLTLYELATPAVVDSQDTGAVELGVKFRSDVAGSVTGVRFYKAAANTGTHTGSLWTPSGTRLAQATFTGESATGWQTATFDTPRPDHRRHDLRRLLPRAERPLLGHARTASPPAFDREPLHALANSASSNGVYAYGPPARSRRARTTRPSTASTSRSRSPCRARSRDVAADEAGSTSADVTWTAPSDRRLADRVPDHAVRRHDRAARRRWRQRRRRRRRSSGSRRHDLHVHGAAAQRQRRRSHLGAVEPRHPDRADRARRADRRRSPARRDEVGARGLDGARERRREPDHRLHGHAIRRRRGARPRAGARDRHEPDGHRPRQRHRVHVPRDRHQRRRHGPRFGPFDARDAFYTLLEHATPPTADGGDPGAVELGVRFSADRPGTVTGVRFYKSAANTGTHSGSLWTAGGTRLAQATFTGESATGWQTATFATPVAVTPGTTYVASYHAPNGHYSVTGAGPRRRARQRPAARARGRQRRVRLRRREPVPDRAPSTRPTTGSTRRSPAIRRPARRPR